MDKLNIIIIEDNQNQHLSPALKGDVDFLHSL